MTLPNIEPYVLAIDVGTSSLKAVVYHRGGEALAASVQRYEYSTPQPGWAEADPESWWNALCLALYELRQDGVPLKEIQAVGLTGQMHTAVLLDEARQVLSPTILWLDRRATQETEELLKAFPLPPYRLNSTYSLPKLVWLARHRPDVVSRVRHVLWPKDYLRYRLTGRILTDLTEAGGAALLDWERLDWSLERLAWTGIAPSALPPLQKATDDAGPLLPEITQQFDLNPGARVITGAGDVLALITAAPPSAHRVSCSMGSSSMVFGPLMGEPISDPEDRIYVYPLLPYPLLGGVSSTSGASLQWAYRGLYGSETTFRQMVAAAQEIEAGAGGLVFLPFLSGERSPFWNDHLYGMFYGLTLTHSRPHMVRAVMEGVAYSLRYLLDIFNETGYEVKEIALCGGGVVDTGWSEMIAAVCKVPVAVFSKAETVTNGIFAYACQALDPETSFKESLEKTFQEPEWYTPDGEKAVIYDRLYQRYCTLAEFSNRIMSRME